MVLDIGPVLDVRDAVGSKVIAMYGRRVARDYIDVFSSLHLGGYSKAYIIELGDRREATPMDRGQLAHALRAVAAIPAEDFANYGFSEADRLLLVREFVRWADEVDPAPPT